MLVPHSDSSAMLFTFVNFFNNSVRKKSSDLLMRKLNSDGLNNWPKLSCILMKSNSEILPSTLLCTLPIFDEKHQFFTISIFLLQKITLKYIYLKFHNFTERKYMYISYPEFLHDSVKSQMLKPWADCLFWKIGAYSTWPQTDFGIQIRSLGKNFFFFLMIALFKEKGYRIQGSQASDLTLVCTH